VPINERAFYDARARYLRASHPGGGRDAPEVVPMVRTVRSRVRPRASATG
jgi:hypothetical protein